MLTFLLISVSSVITAFTLETLYSSSGSIIIERPEVASVFLPGTYEAPNREQRISRINDEVMTRDNLTAIVEKHNLYPEKRGSNPASSVISELKKNFELDVIAAEDDPRRKYVGEVVGFVLTYYHPDPQLAKNVAVDIVDLFQAGNKKRRQDAYFGTEAALARQAEDLRVTVAELESQLANFKTENPGALPEDRNYNRQIVERKERDLTDLDREIRSLQERKTLLQSQLAQTDPYVTTMGPDGSPIAASSDRLQQLQAEYLRLIGFYSSEHPDVMRVRREIDSLSGGTTSPAFRQALEAEYTSKQIALADAENQYGPNHPDVRNLQRSLAALRSQIDSLEANAAEMPAPNNPPYLTLELQLKSVDIELDALQSNKRELQAETSELDEAMQIAPEVERRYLELSRDLEIARKQYEDTMARRMAVTRAGALEASDLAERYVLTRSPSFPEEPSFPNRPLIIMIGIFMGVTFGIGMAILAEVFDDSIRSTRDIRMIVGAPPIAAIPMIRTEQEVMAVTRSKRKNIAAVGTLLLIVAIYVHLQVSGTI